MNIIATRIGKKIFSDLSLGVASHHGGALRRVRLISSTRIAFTSDPAPAPPVTSPEIPTDSITAVVDKIPELGYYPSDLFMRLLESIHVLGDIPYWQSIVIGTVAVRLFILPSSIYGVRMNSRIAFIRPDIDQLRSRMEKDPLNKALYEQEITYLHKKYDANPFTALLPPIIQLPILISIFLGIRRMGTYFPEFMTGGTLWFTDLSVADPTYALPVFSGVTFLLLTELGSSQVNMQNPWFKIALRGISLLAIPLSSTLPSVRLSRKCDY